MGAVTPAMTTSPAAASETAPEGRPRSAGKALDWLLAALANVLVVAAWGITAASVMGSLAIPRRMLMNSEWALDFGRLPQPWMIAVGVVAIVVAHRFFALAMRRYTRGAPAYGASVLAWCGLALGVAYGAYYWAPPVVVGKQVGPAAGQSTRWGIPAYVAYYARLGLPAVFALVAGLLVLFGKQSPWRAFLRGRRRARIAALRRRAAGS